MKVKDLIKTFKPVTPHPQRGDATLCKTCQWRKIGGGCMIIEADLLITSLDGTAECPVRNELCAHYELTHGTY